MHRVLGDGIRAARALGLRELEGVKLGTKIRHKRHANAAKVRILGRRVQGFGQGVEGRAGVGVELGTRCLEPRLGRHRGHEVIVEIHQIAAETGRPAAVLVIVIFVKVEPVCVRHPQVIEMAIGDSQSAEQGDVAVGCAGVHRRKNGRDE